MSLTHYLLLFHLVVVFSAVPLDADPDSHKQPVKGYYRPPYHYQPPPYHRPPHYEHPPAEEAVGEGPGGYHENPSHYKPPVPYHRPPRYGHPPAEEAVGDQEALAKLPFPKPPIFHWPPKFHNLPPYPKKRFPKAPYPKPPPPRQYYKPSVGHGAP